MNLFRVFTILALLPCSSMASTKAPGLYIGLHSEGLEVEGPKFVRPDLVGNDRYFFHISPEMRERHFDGFFPFQAEDGTFGVALHMNEAGLRAYEVMCSSCSGKLLRAVVGGQAVDMLRVDGTRSRDGYIIIWRGFTNQHFVLMEKKLRRLDGQKTETKKSRARDKE